MKGIIVVDIHKSCLDCQFCFEIDEGIEACCTLTADKEDDSSFMMIDDYCQNKPEWCPVKPIPEKKELKGDVSNVKSISEESIKIGWNDCIDEILKGHNL